jgi:hypothetical protein
MDLRAGFEALKKRLISHLYQESMHSSSIIRLAAWEYTYCAVLAPHSPAYIFSAILRLLFPDTQFNRRTNGNEAHN